MVEGPADLGGVSDPLYLGPGGPSSCKNHLVKLLRIGVGENFAYVAQMTFWIDGYVTAIGLADYRVCFFNNRVQAGYFEVLMNQSE